MRPHPWLVFLLSVAAVACEPAPPTIEGATIESVADGDTLTVSIEGEQTEIRLLGINAPEHNECWGDESRAAVLQIAAGETVTVEGTEQDRFGRKLAYVAVDGTDIGGFLLENGHAIAMSDDHPRRAEYFDIEWEAVQAGEGLWAWNACGLPFQSHAVAIAGVEADAPGPDEEDPNGEWVTLINRGDDTDLTGWGMRDESSVHRYEFPNGYVIPAGAAVRLRSGCGIDGPEDLYWCASTPVWNNDGDTAILLDPPGNVVSRYRYGS